MDDEDEGGGIPEWVVTFGDMMSLLLTFFIMLVSLSEVKEKERYQLMVDTLQRRLGHATAADITMRGTNQQRNDKIAVGALAGRAMRKDSMRGGKKREAPEGDDVLVRISPFAKQTNSQLTVTFQRGGYTLSKAERQRIEDQKGMFGGKPHKIAIRGHTGPSEFSGAPDNDEHRDLSFRRARTVHLVLLEMGVEKDRMLLTSLGPTAPLSPDNDPIERKKNPRVEIILLDQTVESTETNHKTEH